MMEYAVVFDYGYWKVRVKPEIGEPYDMGMTFEELEKALAFVQSQTGRPIVFPVLTV